jgi:hypothetical protein
VARYRDRAIQGTKGQSITRSLIVASEAEDQTACQKF